MGQRGRAPAPVALRILKGEDHKERLARAPQPTDPPVRPTDLTKEAGAIWDDVLANASHIGQAHASALRLYSETTATLNAMSPKGSKEWRELVLVYLRLARELCLTPATSVNIARTAPAAEKKLAKYVS